MKPFWITLGQTHSHVLGAKTVDHNIVVEIEAEDRADAMRKAYELFGSRFANIYTEIPEMDYFPGGIFKYKGGYR